MRLLHSDLDKPAVFCDQDRANARRTLIKEAVSEARIGVLMGGDSGEREVSLRSGTGVAQALRAATSARVIGLDVHYESLELESLATRFDLIYNALHGGRGEDGAVQGYLECLSVPYTGPDHLGCAITMDKVTTCDVLTVHDIPIPAYTVVEAQATVDDAMAEALDELSLPLVTKPRDEGSSLGVRFCHDEDGLRAGINELLTDFGGGMVSELIPEPEVTVGIVHGHPVGVLELRAKREFYDYEAKYTKGLTEFICPARLEPEVYERCLRTAIASAEALHCTEMCRVDMRIDAQGVPRVLDVNTSPGMTETSDLPQGAAYLGMSYEDLALEILGTAIVRWGKISADEWR